MSESDLIPGLSAFLACLVLPIQYGILVGIAINIVFILYHAARPKMRIEYLVVTVCNVKTKRNHFYFKIYFLYE